MHDSKRRLSSMWRVESGDHKQDMHLVLLGEQTKRKQEKAHSLLFLLRPLPVSSALYAFDWKDTDVKRKRKRKRKKKRNTM